MSEVQELQTRVRKLSPASFAKFRVWFDEYENRRWDKQIASDSKAGKFDSLIKRAREEFARGKAREL